MTYFPSLSRSRRGVWVPMTCLLALSMFLGGAATPAPAPGSPNFILILADDMGWSSMSSLMDERISGSKSDYYETPALDRLAASGMRFSSGYAPAALCSPTRRSIQMGQTPARQGEDRFQATYQAQMASVLSIPRMLKAANPNYRAAHYGKWDLRANIFPEDLGYDESDGNTGNGNGNVSFDKSLKWTGYTLHKDPKRIESLTQRSLNFIERQAKADQPFYLQLSHYATHVDMQARPETFARFEKKTPGKVHEIPALAAMLADMDEGVGRILDKLEALGLSENTYVIFLTDNGGVPFFPPSSADRLAHPDSYPRPGFNYPLRGGKWTLFEGGIRVPFIVTGPGIEPQSQCEVPVTGWDLLPTIGELSGYSQQLPENVDGVSFADLLTKGNAGILDRSGKSLVFHRYARAYPHSSIRQGNWKLIRLWKTKEVMLFDLAKDLEEKHNLADQRPEKAASLEAALLAYLKSVDAEILQDYPTK